MSELEERIEELENAKSNLEHDIRRLYNAVEYLRDEMLRLKADAARAPSEGFKP